MKTLFLVSLLASAPLALGVVNESLTEKTMQTLQAAGEKTLDAGRSLANGTERAAAAAIDAITPDLDVRRVDVRLSDRGIEIPRKLPPGRTGFIVHNDGKETRGFQFQGEGRNKQSIMSIPPNETKTFHLDLKPGNYRAFSPDEGPDRRGWSADFSVTAPK